MMISKLLAKQFFRNKGTLLVLSLLFILGCIGLVIGKQFVQQQKLNVEKAFIQQEEHIKKQCEFNKDEIGLLMYYLKFSYINPVSPLAGLAIGQRDLNVNIQNIGILNIESQKYNTDLVNPSKLQVGNFDLSFVIIYLFPLVIIALCFNILSEEMEKGTWKMVKIQGKSIKQFLLAKFKVRLLSVCCVLAILFFIAKLLLHIPITVNFISVVIVSFLYILFWFSVCFFVVAFQKDSNTNAIALLTTWLFLAILIPAGISNYITNKYPLNEALALMIKQRDGYHKKWDTDKKKTIDKFYEHYPQFAKYGYGIEDENFNWLWYYAMQQMGDDESKKEKEEMYRKITKREKLSKFLANFVPPIKTQLAMNGLAHSDLNNYLLFLEATTHFHERIRLNFYPRIFERQSPLSFDWNKYKPETYQLKKITNWTNIFLSTIVTTLLLLIFGSIKIRKL